jgi:hypothetical protein
MNEINWMQQGWECPKCGAVMSPTTACCVNCRGNKGDSVSIATGSPLTIDEWAKQQSFPSNLCSSDSGESVVYGKEDPEKQWERYQLNV